MMTDDDDVQNVTTATIVCECGGGGPCACVYQRCTLCAPGFSHVFYFLFTTIRFNVYANECVYTTCACACVNDECYRTRAHGGGDDERVSKTGE